MWCNKSVSSVCLECKKFRKKDRGEKKKKVKTGLGLPHSQLNEKWFSDCRPVPVPYEFLFVSTRDWNCLFNTRLLPLSFLLLSFLFSQIVSWPVSSCSDWEAHHSWRVSEATLPPQKFYVVCFNESGAGTYCFWTHLFAPFPDFITCSNCCILLYSFTGISLPLQQQLLPSVSGAPLIRPNLCLHGLISAG